MSDRDSERKERKELGNERQGVRKKGDDSMCIQDAERSEAKSQGEDDSLTFLSVKMRAPSIWILFLPEVRVWRRTTACSSFSPSKLNFHVTRFFDFLTCFPTFWTSWKIWNASACAKRLAMVGGKRKESPQGKSKRAEHQLSLKEEERRAVSSSNVDLNAEAEGKGGREREER